jgi:hypothetical protein
MRSLSMVGMSKDATEEWGCGFVDDDDDVEVEVGGAVEEDDEEDGCDTTFNLLRTNASKYDPLGAVGKEDILYLGFLVCAGSVK